MSTSSVISHTSDSGLRLEPIDIARGLTMLALAIACVVVNIIWMIGEPSDFSLGVGIPFTFGILAFGVWSASTAFDALFDVQAARAENRLA